MAVAEYSALRTISRPARVTGPWSSVSGSGFSRPASRHAGRRVPG